MVHYIAHEEIGVFSREVCVVVDARLKYCPHGQAGVIYRENGVVLYSYSTPILYLDNDGTIEMLFNPAYSRTTGKHVGYFCREFCPKIGYYTCKKLYNDDVKMNVYTGEIIGKL